MQECPNLSPTLVVKDWVALLLHGGPISDPCSNIFLKILNHLRLGEKQLLSTWCQVDNNCLHAMELIQLYIRWRDFKQITTYLSQVENALAVAQAKCAMGFLISCILKQNIVKE